MGDDDGSTWHQKPTYPGMSTEEATDEFNNIVQHSNQKQMSATLHLEPTNSPTVAVKKRVAKPCDQDDDVDDSPSCDDDVETKEQNLRNQVKVQAAKEEDIDARGQTLLEQEADKKLKKAKKKEEQSADRQAAEAAGYHRLADGSWIKSTPAPPTPVPTEMFPTNSPTATPTDGCTQNDIFAFCASDVLPTYKVWFKLHFGKSYVNSRHPAPVAGGCAETGMATKAAQCRVQPGEAVYWLNEASTPQERDAKQTELMYECYECVFGHVNYFWKRAHQPFLASCASPQYVIPKAAMKYEYKEASKHDRKETRCEMRCAEKLAMKYNGPVMSPMCQAYKPKHHRRLEDEMSFADMWKKNEAKLLKTQRKTYPTPAPSQSPPTHHPNSFYALAACSSDCTDEKCQEVCKCMTACEKQKNTYISCISTDGGYNGDSLAERAILSGYAGMCCDSVSDLLDDANTAIMPSNDLIYGDQDFDYSLYIEQNVCEWASQLVTHNEVCSDEHKHMLRYNKLRADKCPHAHSLPPTPAPVVTSAPSNAPSNAPTYSPAYHPTMPTRSPTNRPTIKSAAFNLVKFLARTHAYDSNGRPSYECKMPASYLQRCQREGGCCKKLTCVKPKGKVAMLSNHGRCYKTKKEKSHLRKTVGKKGKGGKAGCKYDDDYDDGGSSGDSGCDDDKHADDDDDNSAKHK